ncbi:MAG TPA: non-homologous end-joining DNA ligase [Gammaproteobacteria bacterium]|nr:non-homologous end-joining DNA ligase [Gammaproteobacteria bacterium]
MHELLASLEEDEAAKLRREAPPQWASPMLATLTENASSDPQWLYERKFDGIRCLAHSRSGTPILYSRNRRRLDGSYPELVEALAAQAIGRSILDGEVVAFEHKRTSFARLQGRSGIHDAERARASGIAVYYYLFDLLYFDGYDLRNLPLRRRKAILRKVLRFRDPLRYSAHRNRDGEAWRAEACRRGWEGLIAKKADSPYVGRRSPDWRKLKCVRQQEFVIGGFTEPRGSRHGFGALLLGYYERGKLRCAGRVGSGFDELQLRKLHAQLLRQERRSPAFVDERASRHGVHWVEPALVAEIAFTEWTRDGRLRHPRFLGLREDKEAREVRRERPT